MELQYLVAREKLQTKAQATFLARVEEHERLVREAPAGPAVSAWKDQKGEGRGEVMVATMGRRR